VGCIHTSQGLEFDWLGVLIGNDLVFKNGLVVGDPEKRAKNDSSLKGWKSEFRAAESDPEKRAIILGKVQAIIKSTYKVLLSRGRLGCYVWCADAGLRDYLKQRLILASQSAGEDEVSDEINIITDPGAERFLTLVPLYSLEAAASSFGKPAQIDCLGWVRAPQGSKINQRHFAAKVVGKSMEPLIPNGSYGLFKFGVEGSRANRIILAQHSKIADPETGGSYTLKKYQSTKTTQGQHEWEHTSIQLVPVNPTFKPIDITAESAEEISVIAEFITVI
jgi:phage repressor protein C with HTH and peptisase S24 domain